MSTIQDNIQLDNYYSTDINYSIDIEGQQLLSKQLEWCYVEPLGTWVIGYKTTKYDPFLGKTITITTICNTALY